MQLDDLPLELFFIESVVVVHVDHNFNFRTERLISLQQVVAKVLVKHRRPCLCVFVSLLGIDARVHPVEVECPVLESWLFLVWLPIRQELPLQGSLEPLLDCQVFPRPKFRRLHDAVPTLFTVEKYGLFRWFRELANFRDVCLFVFGRFDKIKPRLELVLGQADFYVVKRSRHDGEVELKLPI